MFQQQRILLVCLFAVLIGTKVSTAPAGPLPPTTLWGTLIIDGVAASDGAALRALIGGTEFASTTVFSHEGQQGLYVIDIPSDDPNTVDVIEGGQPGQVIAFAVDGVKIEQTANWEVGDVIQLNLY
jgi:hypothetical protein